MLVLRDRAVDATAFLHGVAATGAMFVARARSTRIPPVLQLLPDGSHLSQVDGLPVRIVEATLTTRGADGSRVRDNYRLITTLRDPRQFPADALVRLYHERWEIESAFLALRHTTLDGHVLRSGDRPRVEQEIWALLTLYAQEYCSGVSGDRAPSRSYRHCRCPAYAHPRDASPRLGEQDLQQAQFSCKGGILVRRYPRSAIYRGL